MNRYSWTTLLIPICAPDFISASCFSSENFVQVDKKRWSHNPGIQFSTCLRRVSVEPKKTWGISMEVPPIAGWMVYFMDNSMKLWMMKWGSLISGNLHMDKPWSPVRKCTRNGPDMDQCPFSSVCCDKTCDLKATRNWNLHNLSLEQWEKRQRAGIYIYVYRYNVHVYICIYICISCLISLCPLSELDMN